MSSDGEKTHNMLQMIMMAMMMLMMMVMVTDQEGSGLGKVTMAVNGKVFVVAVAEV